MENVAFEVFLCLEEAKNVLGALVLLARVLRQSRNVQMMMKLGYGEFVSTYPLTCKNQLILVRSKANALLKVHLLESETIYPSKCYIILASLNFSKNNNLIHILKSLVNAKSREKHVFEVLSCTRDLQIVVKLGFRFLEPRKTSKNVPKKR